MSLDGGVEGGYVATPLAGRSSGQGLPSWPHHLGRLIWRIRFFHLLSVEGHPVSVQLAHSQPILVNTQRRLDKRARAPRRRPALGQVERELGCPHEGLGWRRTRCQLRPHGEYRGRDIQRRWCGVGSRGGVGRVGWDGR